MTRIGSMLVRVDESLPPDTARLVDANGRVLAIITPSGMVLSDKVTRAQVASDAAAMDASPSFVETLKGSCDGEG